MDDQVTPGPSWMSEDDVERIAREMQNLAAGDETIATRFEALRHQDAEKSRSIARIGIALLVLNLLLVLGVGLFAWHDSRRSASERNQSIALGKENHETLVLLEAALSPDSQAKATAATQAAVNSIVTTTDCNVRRDLADALVLVIPPPAVITFPATPSCPVYTPHR